MSDVNASMNTFGTEISRGLGFDAGNTIIISDVVLLCSGA